MLKVIENIFEFGYVGRKYVDFKTTGRWKTIYRNSICSLHIEIVKQKDISKWYQRVNMQPVTEWVHEDNFIEVEPIIETINECN